MAKESIVHTDSIQRITYYRRDTKKGVIYAYFRVNKKMFRLSTGKTSIQEAVIAGNAMKQNALGGKEVKVLTLRKAFEKYIEYKKHYVKENTVKDYIRVANFIDEFIGSEDAKSINQNKLDNLVQWRRNYYKLNEGKALQTYKRNGKSIEGRRFTDDVSNRTINLLVTTVLSVLRYASEHLHYLELSEIPKWKQLRENKREEFISEDELHKIYKFFRSKNMHYHAEVVSFAFYTGIRLMSELNRIQWKDVNWQDKFILIRNRKNRNRILHSPVPMYADTEEILKSIEKRNKPKSLEDYVFVNTKGEKVKSIGKSFKTAVFSCNLNTDYTPYALRHGFATFAITKLKMDLYSIAHIMGHADTKMIESVYGHLQGDVLIEQTRDAHKTAMQNGKAIKSLFKGNTLERFFDIE